MSVQNGDAPSRPVLSAWGEPSCDLTSRVLGELLRGTGRGLCGDERFEVETPGSFWAAAEVLEPGLVSGARSELTEGLNHLLDGHRVFLPYLMAGHFPALSKDASPSVTLLRSSLLVSPFTGRVCVAVRVEDSWREFAVWVEPRHLAHRDCDVCTPVWSDRVKEFEAAQVDLAAVVAAGGEEYLPILFAQADLHPQRPGDGTGVGWRRPRVIVHADDVRAGRDERGTGSALRTGRGKGRDRARPVL